MTIESKDTQIIRSLIPLATLPTSRFEKLCAASHVEDAPRGAVLFRQGDGKPAFVYLLGGKVALQAGGVEMDIIEAGSETARFALAHQIPRKVSAIAKNKVRFVRVDPSFLYVPDETSKPPSSYDVSDIPQESPNDWMTALLRLPLFQQLPAAHLQKLLMELEEVRVKSGRRILVQGERTDHYYIIKTGRCTLSRKPSPDAKDIVIARLKACDTIGEDALISSEPSEVSATMLTDGALLRVDRSRFLQSIKEPLLRSIDLNTPRQEPPGDSTLLDVRPPEEFERKHLHDSINMPFFFLPMQLSKLDKNKHHIVICNDGKMSEMATFLLIKNGFHAVVLKNGLNGVPKEHLLTARCDETSKILVQPTRPPDAQQKNASPAQKQMLETPPKQRVSVRRHEEKHDEGMMQASVKGSKQACETPSTGARGTLAETAEPTELVATSRKRIAALEKEPKALRDQTERDQLKMAASLRALQEQLDTSVAERQSLNNQLTQKTDIIAELESTIRGLSEQNTGLQQQIKILRTAATDKQERSSELEVLRPDMGMIPR